LWGLLRLWSDVRPNPKALQKKTNPTDSEMDTSTDPPPDESFPSTQSDGFGEADIAPVPRRDVRRLSIRALKKSIEQVTGVEWLEDGLSGFEVFSSTLGVPDYAQSVAEDLDPGMMFYKQMMNAASFSCEAMVINDLELDLSQRKMLYNISEESTEPTEIRTTIAKALVRFHGEEESLSLDGVLVSKWYDLWWGLHDRREAIDSGEPEDYDVNLMVWQLICEAMILSPQFYSY
jgi:hypothetical protein